MNGDVSAEDILTVGETFENIQHRFHDPTYDSDNNGPIMMGPSKYLPLATENLLENTDGASPLTPRVKGGRSIPSVFSRDGTLLPSSYADARCVDGVVVSKDRLKRTRRLPT